MQTNADAVRTVEATYRKFIVPEGVEAVREPASIPGAKYGEDGLLLFREYQWGVETASGRESIDGVWGFVHDGRMHYQKQVAKYDGSVLRGRGPSTGVIREVGNQFLEERSPLFLTGRTVAYEPSRSLTDVLSAAADVEVSREKHGGADEPRILMSCTFEESGETLALRASLDPQRGYMPVEIVVSDVLLGLPSRRYRIHSLVEAQDGVWIPLCGDETIYATFLKIPPGMTEDAYRSAMEQQYSEQLRRLNDARKEGLPAAEIARIHAEIGLEFEARALGVGTMTYVLDPDTLRVNQPIPKSRFDLEFPEGMKVWDDFAQQTITVGSGL